MSDRPGAPGPHEALEAGTVRAGVVIEISDIPILLRAADVRRAEAVASLFRHARITSAAPRCTLAFVDDHLVVPDAPPTVTGAHAELWYEEPATVCIRSRDGLVARGDDRTILIGGDRPALAREFRFVCLIALTHLLARHGVHLLHGAATVAGGRAVLVLGDTGTGKSTLAFAAHARGWPVLADDAVLVRRAGTAVHAVGLPRPISVAADVVVDAIHGGRPVPDDLRGRTELAPGTLATTTHPVVAVLALLGGDGRGTRLEPMQGAERLRTVLKASASLGDPTVRPELFALAGTIARLPVWSVRHGGDPRRAFDDATAILDELSRALDALRADPDPANGS